MATRRPNLAPLMRRQLNCHVRQGGRSRFISTTAPRTVTVADGGLDVSYDHPSTGATRSVLPSFWLRDNCRCAKCVNQATLQRNFATFQIPKSIAPLKAEAEKDGLRVTWSGDNHESFYPWDFISFYQQNDHRGADPVNLKLWGSEVESDPPTVDHEEAMARGGMGKLTKYIREVGFVFVANTPHSDPEPTRQLLEQIGPIRNTHYGGFYDFVPDLAKADTAYTNLALPAHTDTTYFSDPAGLQSFHLLEHHAPATPSGSDLGGKSLLVDGFRCAEILRREDPRAFEVLATVRLPWHASGNEGITIAPDRRYPVLELDNDGSNGDVPLRERPLHRVRWNNDDRGVVPFGGRGIDPVEWYDAARKWDEILRRRDAEYWVQLRPGTILIFDNWRVLHGRSAFVGLRRICGGYINRDDFISKYRNSNFPREEVLKQVIG